MKTPCLLFLFVLLFVGCDSEMGTRLENHWTKSELPEPPLKVTWRESLVSGLVMQVTNTSDTDLQFIVDIKNIPLNQQKNVAFYLPAKKMKEYGILELDWTFQTGEEIIFKHSDYKTVFKRVPRTLH